MASRRRKRERRASEALQHSTRPLTARLLRPLPLPVTRFQSLTPVEDRRTYHPLQKFRPARQVSGHPVKPNKVSSPGKKMQMHLSHRIGFAEAARTVICVRRKTRKEVLFAKFKTGKGARARSRRRNVFSEVSC